VYTKKQLILGKGARLDSLQKAVSGRFLFATILNTKEW